MLSVVHQHCRCAARCLRLKPATAEVLVKRNYENPNTQVFERLTPINQVGADKYPALKRKHYIYKKVEPKQGLYKTTIKCILTREIEGIGLKGTLVEVKKNIFRNVLYPSGDAVYASPENIEYYKKYRQISIEEGIDYDMKQLMMKLSGLHLPVYMNPHESWTLSTDHLRVALRKQGVWVEAQNLIPPKTPVTLLGEFTFKIQMSNRLATHVRGTVVPIDEEGQADLDTELPPMWGNEPLNEKAPLEYLKNTQETEPDAEDK